MTAQDADKFPARSGWSLDRAEDAERGGSTRNVSFRFRCVALVTSFARAARNIGGGQADFDDQIQGFAFIRNDRAKASFLTGRYSPLQIRQISGTRPTTLKPPILYAMRPKISQSEQHP